MSAELDDLKASVADQKTVVASAATLMDGLAKQIDDLVAAGGSAADFTALAADIRASSQALADATTRDARGQPIPLK